MQYPALLPVAQTLFEYHTRCWPNCAEGYACLAKVHGLMGVGDAAILNYEKALKIAPDNGEYASELDALTNACPVTSRSDIRPVASEADFLTSADILMRSVATSGEGMVLVAQELLFTTVQRWPTSVRGFAALAETFERLDEPTLARQNYSTAMMLEQDEGEGEKYRAAIERITAQELTPPPQIIHESNRRQTSVYIGALRAVIWFVLAWFAVTSR
ncbi:MAG: tetratricopeptide repeat protein [Alphaproteobacteria bacterium]